MVPIGLHLVAELQTDINNEKVLRVAASRVIGQLPEVMSSVLLQLGFLRRSGRRPR